MERFCVQLNNVKVAIIDPLEENKKLEARVKVSEKGKIKDRIPPEVHKEFE